MEIKFGIRKVQEVNAFLKSLPRGTIRAALEAFAIYLIGDSRRGLKHDDPYKYVTRKKAYGRTFVSDAQRRYVMGAIARGEIRPGQRKNSPTKASGGYGHRETRGGYGQTITNKEPGGYWTRIGQPAQLKLVGWRAIEKVISDNLKGAIRSATAAANKYLAKKGR